jgi:hypothetical protein
MRIICGGDTGLTKTISPEKDKLILDWGKQSKDKSISQMCWADPTIESEVIFKNKISVS